MKRFYKTLTLSMMLLSPMVVSPVWAQEPLELEFSYVSPRQQNQVAFVPFAGDSVASSVIINDLKNTELTITTQNLPQQPHSSSELGATLPVWQQLAIPYLVIGSSQSNKGKIVYTYEVINVKTGQVLNGRQTLTVSNDRQSLKRAGHLMADKIYELITGVPGDFSGKIAYIEETGRGNQKVSALRVMDADGENAKTLMQVQGSIFSPTWSPDAKRLAYSVQRTNGYPVIYVQNVDGGSPQLVTPYKGNNLSPSFSPDGSRLLFSSSFEGNADIYQLSLGSGKLQKLVSMPSNEVQPSFAPDGRSFVFVSDKIGENHPQIYRYDFASGKVSQVSRGGYAASPQFSHDGSKIAFLSGRSAAVMSSSGAMIKNFGATGIDEAPRFSPNGRRVVFASKRGNQGVITIQPLNGGEPIGKSANGIIRSPVWSPNPK